MRVLYELGLGLEVLMNIDQSGGDISAARTYLGNATDSENSLESSNTGSDDKNIRKIGFSTAENTLNSGICL